MVDFWEIVQGVGQNYPLSPLFPSCPIYPIPVCTRQNRFFYSLFPNNVHTVHTVHSVQGGHT
jgi:hypothetical protein